MNYRNKYITFAYLIVSLCSFNCASRHKDSLVYPGAGIPFLSKDIVIKKVQEELRECSLHHENISFNKGRLEFVDISDFTFLSSYKISGDGYILYVDLRIFSGECSITVGNLQYLIWKKGIKVFNNGEELYVNDNCSVNYIDIQKVPGCFWGCTRLKSNGRFLEMIDTPVETPAIIKIELTDDCSGYIGPWVWLRYGIK